MWTLLLLLSVVKVMTKEHLKDKWLSIESLVFLFAAW